MRSRRSSDAAWSEAAARRLAQLTADLGGQGAMPMSTDEGPEHGPDAATEPRADWWADHTRVVRSDPDAETPAPRPGVSEPAPLPRPGRHAARRGPAWRPPTPALPVLGSSHLAVVALLAAAGLALTAWWVARDSAEPVQAVPVTEASPLVPQPSSTAGVAPAASDAAATAAASSGSAAAGEVTVDVTGRVRHPGIVVLDVGARVIDALEAAGGARPGVDLTSLNLARVLTDGEQIVVGQATPAVPAAPSATSTSAGPATLVNLNTASETELESLPEVGPVTAQAIIGWRDEHGGFTSVDELLEVDGIGEATLAQITPYVTV